ncbi:hypothetical protein AB0280_17650 [Pseudarthrobacter sp902506025]|uniref:hypothetical protein n=1 Tax=Pseudarthrobacter sp. 902506025 TaxID=3155291 RepID=UPI00344DCEA1
MINLLDGLRDLKAPLASGFIVLFGLWLIFENEISKAVPGPTITSNLRQLCDYLGGPATLGLVAFVAYLLGTLLSLGNALLRMPIRYKMQRMRPTTQQRLANFLDDEIQNAMKHGRSLEEIHDDAYSHFVRQVTPATTEEEPEAPEITKAHIVDDLIYAIVMEVDILATQLHATKEKAYEIYDKNRSEAKFRFSVAAPVIFVGIVLAVRLGQEQHDPWPFLVVALSVASAVRFLQKSFERQDEAIEVIVNAVLLGHVEVANITSIRSNIPKQQEKPSWLERGLDRVSSAGRSIANRLRSAVPTTTVH